MLTMARESGPTLGRIKADPGSGVQAEFAQTGPKRRRALGCPVMGLGMSHRHPRVGHDLSQLSERTRRGHQDQAVVASLAHDLDGPGAHQAGEVGLAPVFRRRSVTGVGSRPDTVVNAAPRTGSLMLMERQVAKLRGDVEQRSAAAAFLEHPGLAPVGDQHQAGSGEIHVGLRHAPLIGIATLRAADPASSGAVTVRTPCFSDALIPSGFTPPGSRTEREKLP